MWNVSEVSCWNVFGMWPVFEGECIVTWLK